MNPSINLIAQTTATDTPWWVGVIVVVGLAGVITSLIARSKGQQTKPMSRDAWKDHAVGAHAELRFLYDEATEDAAIGAPDRLPGLQERETAAREHLYLLEASAPDNRVRGVAVECNEATQELMTAYSARRGARRSYEETDAGDPEALRTARDREVRASRNLSNARLRLDAAISSLSRVA